MKNKKYMLMFAFLVLLLLPFQALAVDVPNQIGLVNLSFYGGIAGCQNHASLYSDNVVSWSNFTAFVCRQGDFDFNLGVVHSIDKDNNFLIYDEDISTGSTIDELSITYENGYLLLGADLSTNGAIWIYDVSDVQFIEQETAVACPSDVGLLFPFKADFPFRIGTTSFSSLYKVNETECVTEDSLNATLESNTILDKDNLVFSAGNDFYSYTEDWGSVNTSLVYSLPASKGTHWVEWIRNPNNPLWITNDGFVTLTGGSSYGDIKNTNLPIVQGTTIAYQDVDNIISENATEFLLTDFSSLLTPVITNSGQFSNGTAFKRTTTDRFVGTNISSASFALNNMLIEIYNISSPDLTIFAEGLNPPNITADFLGVDLQGGFVFLTEMADADGGRVYSSQSLFEASVDIGGIIPVSEVIDFSDPNDENKVLNLDPIISFPSVETQQLEFFNGTAFFDEYYITSNSIPFNANKIFLNFNDEVLDTETDAVQFSAVMTGYDFSVGFFDTTFNYKLIDSLDKEVFNLEITYEKNLGQDTYTINRIDGGSTLLATGDLYENSGDLDLFIISSTVDFVNNESLIAINGRNGTLYNGTVPFVDSDVNGINRAVQETEAGSITKKFYIDLVGYSHFTTIEDTLDFELFENLEAGVSVIKATRQDGSYEFGQYSLYSYGTDEDFGFSFLGSSHVETFDYDEDTTVLSENDIEDALEQAQADVSDLFIEGDILTDKALGYVESLGCISTACKLSVGAIIVLAGAGLGFGWAGMVGSLLGAVFSILITAELQLIPSWVTVTVIIGVAILGAYEARRAMAGRGG